MVEYADSRGRRGTSAASGLEGLAHQAGMSVEHVVRLARSGQLHLAMTLAGTSEGQARRRVEARRREQRERGHSVPASRTGLSGRLALVRTMGMRWPAHETRRGRYGC